MQLIINTACMNEDGRRFGGDLRVTDHSSNSRITMGHGGGGKLTAQLIDSMIRPMFSNSSLEAQHDGAIVKLPQGRIAFSTDSYVVNPLFFPGGDIGTLAVTGTVNDLVMCGARPNSLSCGLIIEEGFSTELLMRVIQSMKSIADKCSIEIVTGDIKVVERGRGDGLFINTSGLGVLEHDLSIQPQSIQDGDVILLSGDLGRHGMAVLSEREGLQFESQILSDCASLIEPVMALIQEGIEVHCLRDLTRGGLATALVELAQSSGLSVYLNESAIRVCDEVRGACEILGLDPLYVANEGRFVAIVHPDSAQKALEILHAHPVSAGAVLLGGVHKSIGNLSSHMLHAEPSAHRGGRVILRNRFGSDRLMDRLSGEQLPRIC